MATVTPYSANVVLTLTVGGRSYALSHLGPNEFVVRDECPPISAGNAIIVIRVDNKQKTKRVYLPDGVPAPNQPVKFF
jgi:hypothetical protein